MSLRPTLLGLVVVLSGSDLAAQNLVTNPSLEDVDPCPDNWSQIDHATGWASFRTSPDLFHGCSGDLFGVPGNLFGTRMAADGEGYAGLYGYHQSIPNYREYIGAVLTQPLQVGVPAQVSFKVAAAGGGGASFIMQYWCSHIGVRFSMEQWYQPEGITTVFGEADLVYDNVISYSPSWITVSGMFIPDSAYQYIVVGNFFSDSAIDLVPTGDPAANMPSAYYFVDDFCVSQGAGASCDMATAIPNASTGSSATAYFDPSAGAIRVTTTSSPSMATLIDGSGRRVLAKSVSGTISLPADGLPTGIYLIQLVGEGSVSSFKVFVP